jgi:hypothetical protein
VKKLILIATVLAAAACGKKSAPVIGSFTADKSEIVTGESVTFSFVVTGATRITLSPDPGVVTASPVTVSPGATTTYTLRAENEAGAASQDLTVLVKPPATAARIVSFNALPSQVAAGGQVTLSWTVANAVSINVSDGSASPPTDVTAITQKVVTPSATTTYTMTVTGFAGTNPATSIATALARVAAAARISSFTASPSAINQGQAVTLNWDGSASSWSLSDGTTNTDYGPLKTATVRPSANTTYTLTAKGIGGNDTRPLPITVTPQPGTTLVYTAPAGGSLRLLADCSSCTPMTFRLVGSIPLRGVALNLPLDATKVSFDPTTFAAPFASDVPPAAKAVFGTGPLKNTLVLGVARKGNGTSVAADATPGAEIAHFTLALVPAGGKGIVFDGTGAFSRVQSAAGAALGQVAVGTLEVR